MLNERKVRVMTQAALYESSYQYRKDYFIRRYYLPDYIAINRFVTKIWLTIFYIIAVGAYVFQLVYVQSVDLLHFDYQGFAVKVVLIYLIASILVSILTSAYYGSRYAKAERRVHKYFRYLDEIDTYQK
ncbi:MAG: hypothetical protein IJK56_05835 [Firmicutes bacterium]|nr:hypothetical protein [Bacillota bacterium]